MTYGPVVGTFTLVSGMECKKTESERPGLSVFPNPLVTGKLFYISHPRKMSLRNAMTGWGRGDGILLTPALGRRRQVDL